MDVYYGHFNHPSGPNNTGGFMCIHTLKLTNKSCSGLKVKSIEKQTH